MEIIRGHAISTGILFGRLSFTAPQAEMLASVPTVLYAEALTPAQILSLSRGGICTFILSSCSDTAHAAILARNTGCPSLYGIRLGAAYDGMDVIVDGNDGLLILQPDSNTIAAYRQKQAAFAKETERLAQYKGKLTVTRSGRRIGLFANINSPSDLELSIQNDAEGIFFKTEFMYLASDRPPTEEELFTAYKDIAVRMGARPTVIRTIDIGADKTADYFQMPQEENPALGVRGIRLCFAREEIFLTQLRAILRAAAYGNVAVMFPMIAVSDEILHAKEYLQKAREQLDAVGMVYAEDLRVGVMIETPSAALSIRQIAACVDFISIGTNDLTQYLFAVDRQNAALAQCYDPHHPILLELLTHIIKNAKTRGIEVGISGALGADPTMTERFLADGMDLLAVPPTAILPLRQKICNLK